MLKFISKIGSISATIRKVADTIHVGADAFDVLKKLTSIWQPKGDQKAETTTETITEIQNDENH